MRVLQWLFNSVSGPSVSTATEENKVKSQGKGHRRWGAVVSKTKVKEERGSRALLSLLSLWYMLWSRMEELLYCTGLKMTCLKKVCVHVWKSSLFSFPRFQIQPLWQSCWHKVFFGYGAVMHRKCWHGSHMLVPKYLSHLFIVTYLYSQHTG